MARSNRINCDFSFTARADTVRANKAISDLQKEYSKLLSLPDLDRVFKGNGDKNLQQTIKDVANLRSQLLAATNMNLGLIDFTQFNRSLKASNTSVSEYVRGLQSLGPQGQQVFRRLAESVVQAEVPINRANQALTNFFNTLKNNARWQLTSEIVDGFIHGLQGALRYAESLDQSLNNIRIVSGQTSSQMADFAVQANKAAKELNTSTVAYTDAALIYYQQGLKGQDVLDRADITVQMSNVTGDNVETVSNQLTSIWNNFAKSSDDALVHYADVLTALGAATASSTDEIADGLQKFSSIADMIGLSYDSAAASLATITAKTRQTADVVGTALKISA